MVETYSELMRLQTYDERLMALAETAKAYPIGHGWQRFRMHDFVAQQRWKRVRDDVIIRDWGCDLAIQGMKVNGTLIVHHIVPLTSNDILFNAPVCYDPENLICAKLQTHNAIHFEVSENFLRDTTPAIRTPYDTLPWRRGGSS